jgi:paraquat-inducible protein B
MPKRFSSTAIGVFVMGSLALIIAALAVLGSGQLFKQSHKFICFFQGNVNGLKAGAAVKVRGVEIGSVSAIRLRPLPSEGQLKPSVYALTPIPVIIDIDETQLKAQGASGAALRPEEFNALVKRGLRAQLQTESLLTGLLYVDLDVHPGAPLNLMLQPGTGGYPEIPTVPTDIEQIREVAMKGLAKLQNVDFVKLTESITNAGNAATNLLSSPEVKATLESLQDATKNLDRTITTVRGMVENLNNRSGPTLASLRKAADQATLTLAQISSTATTLRAGLAPDSPLAYRLSVALDNLSEASSGIRELTDYLQRNPSAIVRGRYSESTQ